jgi:hypothetical protein
MCLTQRTVDKRHARTILAAFADTFQVTVQELVAAKLQALLNDLGRILIHAVLCGKAKDVVNGSASIGRRSVFADMLNAPIAELAVCDDIDAGKNLVDARTLANVSHDTVSGTGCTCLVLFETILEDILHHQTACLTESDLVPHTT